MVPPKSTRPEWIACIGHDELIDDNSTVHIFPARPHLASHLVLKIANCQLFVPQRQSVETKATALFHKVYPNAMNSTTVKVLNRTLKIGNNCFVKHDFSYFKCITGLHNGHTLVGNNWNVQPLIEDKDDHDILLTSEAVVNLAGYLPDIFMAIVFLVEYEIGCTAEVTPHQNMKKLLFATSDASQCPVTSVLLGSAMYVPYDGNSIQLSNLSPHQELNDGVNIEIKLVRDESCSIFSPVPVISDSEQLYSPDEKAQSKPRERLSYVGEKLSSSYFDNTRQTARKEEDEQASLLGFDLRVFHPLKGEIRKEDILDNICQQEEDHDRKDSEVDMLHVTQVPGTKPSAPAEEVRFRERENFAQRPLDAEETDSLSESIVTGDSYHSSVRLDKTFYAYSSITNVQKQGKEDKEQERVDFDMNNFEKRDSNKGISRLLGSAMNVHFSPTDFNNSGNLIAIDGTEGTLKLAKKTSVTVKENRHFMRELSRGAKSRLSRHGIQDSSNDSTTMNIPTQQTSVDHKPVDITREVSDECRVHEVGIQFVGFRAAVANETSRLFSPRAIYLSYQFYTCSPTRTEPLKLLPAENGEVCVLVRDETGNDPPLTLRYIMDFSRASAFEALEFSEFLALKSLYVDVWDADSLLHLGTIGIPLRIIMRQGLPLVRRSIECDLVNSENTANCEGGITSLTIMENGPILGEVIGSISVILSNFGARGNPMIPTKSEEDATKFNWRAHNLHTSDLSHSNKPKTLVLAKPLTEKSPELSKALTDLRQFPNNISFRSFAGGKIHEGSTLNYDEVVLIFKRFQGNAKAAVQYSGDLLLLLDIPSLPIAMKKVIKAYRGFADEVAFRTVSRYTIAWFSFIIYTCRSFFGFQILHKA